MTKKAVLAMFGCFNPPTNGHLQLLAIARNTLEEKGYTVVKGLFVPTHGGYMLKHGMCSGKQRVEMCRLASKASFGWIDVDPFETEQESWTRVVVSLAHIQSLYPDCRIFIACGIDFVQRWNDPIWAEEDCRKILSDYGLCIASRDGADLNESFKNIKYINDNTENVFQIGYNILSMVNSTYVRERIEQNKLVTGLLCPFVEEYIVENKLYSSGD